MYFRFHQAILQFRFTIVEEDHCVYLKRSDIKFLIMILYVDDILMASNDLETMKDIGDASYVLGVKIYGNRSKRVLGLSQKMYAKTS